MMKGITSRSIVYYGLATSSMIYLYKYPEVARRDGFNTAVVTSSSKLTMNENDSDKKMIQIKRYRVVNDYDARSYIPSLIAYPQSLANKMYSFLWDNDNSFNSSSSSQQYHREIQFRTYTADWCGPCNRAAPHIEELERQGKIQLIHKKEIAVDENKRRNLIIPCFDVIQITEGIEAESSHKDVNEANIKVVYSVQTTKLDEIQAAVNKAKVVKNEY